MLVKMCKTAKCMKDWAVCDSVLVADVPISRATQIRIAIRAPVLRPTGRKMASAEQVSREPPASQEHTLMVSVAVLL